MFQLRPNKGCNCSLRRHSLRIHQMCIACGSEVHSLANIRSIPFVGLKDNPNERLLLNKCLEVELFQQVD